MRTSLNEIAKIEKYIFRKLSAKEKLLFDARMILDPDLKMKVFLQKKIYKLLNLFYGKELKKQAEGVFAALMEKPEFKNEITKIFKPESHD
jgi:hypothetical protein